MSPSYNKIHTLRPLRRHLTYSLSSLFDLEVKLTGRNDHHQSDSNYHVSIVVPLVTRNHLEYLMHAAI